MRRLLTLFVLPLLARPAAAQQPTATAPAPAAHPSVEFSGLVLINGFFTNSRVNNSDVPQLAEADTSGVAGSGDRKSTCLNSSHIPLSRMPSSA